MEDKLTADEIVKALMQGDVDSDLDKVYNACRDRQKIVGRKNLLTLREGAKVELFGLSPKTLNGLQGTIKATPAGRRRNTTRFDVQLDHEIILRNQLTTVVHGVPSECIKAVE